MATTTLTMAEQTVNDVAHKLGDIREDVLSCKTLLDAAAASIAQASLPATSGLFPTLTYYAAAMMSQRHPSIAKIRYSLQGDATGTFGSNGCLVMTLRAYCILVGVLPASTTPVEFAAMLEAAKCFGKPPYGNYLSVPSRLEADLHEKGFPNTERIHWNADGYREWKDSPADHLLIRDKLLEKPTILCVDWQPADATIQTHWMLGLGWVEDTPGYPGYNDIILYDPYRQQNGLALLSNYFDGRWRPNPTLVSRVSLAMWDLGA